ncbi:MAG: hypothetical protein ACRC6E_09720 [Fusobacteriaceae bacterium]
MKKKISISFPLELIELIKAEGLKENRNFTNMVIELIKRGLK